MAKSSQIHKRRPFTFLELSISIALLSLVFLPLGMSGEKLLRKWQYEEEISKLKDQLQLAYDFVLHCDIPAEVTFKITKKGLACRLNFENKLIEKKNVAYALYPQIKKMILNDMRIIKKKVTFSSSGDYSTPLHFTFIGKKKDQKKSITLKGYPHVLYVQSN